MIGEGATELGEKIGRPGPQQPPPPPASRPKGVSGDQAKREQMKAEELIPMKTTEKGSSFDKF